MIERINDNADAAREVLKERISDLFERKEDVRHEVANKLSTLAPSLRKFRIDGELIPLMQPVKDKIDVIFDYHDEENDARKRLKKFIFTFHYSHSLSTSTGRCLNEKWKTYFFDLILQKAFILIITMISRK